MEIRETNCCIKHHGQSYCAGGAVITDTHIVAYMGDKLSGNPLDTRFNLTDWHGNKIGYCAISSTWATPHSYVSSHMHQVYAYVNGVQYTGRCAGKGMIFKGKRTAKQPC